MSADVPLAPRVASALDGARWPEPAVVPVGPLAGVRVLDLSRILAGPYAGMVLADLGADVVKVERPGAGDDTRRWGPPFHGADATYFYAVNRNRRALALDLASPAARPVLAALVAAADVVLENFLPRHATSLGLDELRATAPTATWVSIRGAGSDGPDAALPGYDVMAQARSGLMHVTGQPDGPPTKVGVALADVIAGLHAAVAALAGVAARARGTAAAPGGGLHVEVPLLESTLAALVNQASAHLIGGADPGRLGNDHPSIAPYGPLACADRMLVLGAGNDRQFASLVDVLGRPELAADERFATNAARVAHRDELRLELEAELARRPAAAWTVALGAAGVPSAPVQSVAEALADPQVAATDLVQEVDGVRLVASPLLVDGVRPQVRSGPPALGADTDAVLAGLGLPPALIDELRAAGVVA